MRAANNGRSVRPEQRSAAMYNDTLNASAAIALDSAELPVEVAGGKGAGLSRLMRAGFPVPSGFVIASSVYQEFIEANGLADDIAAGEASALRAEFDSGELPEAIVESILAAYRRLAGGALV